MQVWKVAAANPPEEKTTHLSEVADSSRTGSEKIAPALRRLSLSVHKWVAAVSSGNWHFSAMSMARPKPSCSSSCLHCAVSREAIFSTSQPSEEAPKSISVSGPLWEKDA